MVEVFVPATGRVCAVGDTGEGNVTPAQPAQGQTFLRDRRGPNYFTPDYVKALVPHVLLAVQQ